MNILPRHHSQFQKLSYWNQFFKKTKSIGQQFFEWYGQWDDYKFFPVWPSTGTYIHLGIGKSKFAQQIGLLFPNTNQLGVDYSQQVINQMKKDCTLPNVQYNVLDLLKDIQNEYQQKFDYVIDKGTLDAILCTPQATDIILNNYFPNVTKFMKMGNNSTYIIISMLQPFVLQTIIQAFNSYCLQIYQCKVKGSDRMQPFLVRISFCKSEMIYYSLNSGQLTPSSKQQLKKIVQKRQNYGSTDIVIAGRSLSFTITNTDHKPAYEIELYDSSVKGNTCSVVIVPSAKSKQPSYRPQSLSEYLQVSRVIIVHWIGEFHNKFNSTGEKQLKTIKSNVLTTPPLSLIKSDLNSIVPQLLPKGIQPSSVQYIAQQPTTILYVSKNIKVQQNNSESESWRRMIHKTNAKVLAQVRIKHKINQMNKLMMIDHSYLCELHERVITTVLCGIYLSRKKVRGKIQRDISLLYLGGGACTIPSYFNHNLKGIQTYVLQLYPDIVQAAHTFFEVPQQSNTNYNLIVGDAFTGYQKYGKTHHWIVIDITAKDGGMMGDKFCQVNYLVNIYAMVKQVMVIIGRNGKSMQYIFNKLVEDQRISGSIWGWIDDPNKVQAKNNKQQIKSSNNNKQQIKSSNNNKQQAQSLQTKQSFFIASEMSLLIILNNETQFPIQIPPSHVIGWPNGQQMVKNIYLLRK